MKRSISLRLAVLWLAALLGACTAPQPPERGILGQLVIDGVPQIPAELVGSLWAYQHTRSARFLGWLDTGILISTRFGNTAQLHRVNEPLGVRSQVTFFDEPISTASVSPDPAIGGFLYVKDVGGSEFYQLFWFDLESGQSTLLTDGESRYTAIKWGKSGRRFAYTTTERNGVDWDVHIQDLAGNASVALQGRGVGWTATDWSPDEERLLVTKYVSIQESYLYEVELATGEVRSLLDETLSAAIDDAHYDGSGDYIFFTSDMGAEFIRLHRLNRVTGAIDVVTADIAWNVEEFTVSSNGERLAFITNEGGMSHLHVLELADLSAIELPEIPSGIIYALAFTPAGDALGFVVNHASMPADVFSVDLSRASLIRWTQSELGGIAARDIVEPELISYTSFDDREIPAFVFRPRTAGPHPVLINIHGGPEGQFRPFFSYSTQYYVNEMGIAVIAPNVRGSTGYGKTYLKLDNGILREDSVKDIGALLDWVERQDDLDAQRVVVIGGSYGGYMVLASLVHFSDRLKGGVERVGISNFVSFLENTQAYRRDLRRAEYGDERDAEMRVFLEKISPLNRVDQIAKPMLISQGLNDPRVPVGESEQIVAALKRRGVPVWYVLALDEGHGYRKKLNRDYLNAATALFLQRHLID